MDQDSTAWEEHLRAYRQSGLSVRAYARQHGLAYHRLLYRLRRAAKADSSPFVAVTVAGRGGITAPLAHVALPNGIRIEVYDAPLAVSMLEHLVGQR